MKNAIKMFVGAILLTAVASMGQDVKPTTVRGHALGETIDAYLDSVALKIPQQHPLASVNAADLRAKCKASPKHRLCASIAEVDQTGQALFPDPTGADYFFSGGKLADVTITFLGGSFDSVMQQLVEKYGPPTHSGTVEVQNGFGARFEVGQATWAMPDRVDIEVTQTVRNDSVLGLIKPITVRFAPHVTAKPAANQF